MGTLGYPRFQVVDQIAKLRCHAVESVRQVADLVRVSHREIAGVIARLHAPHAAQQPVQRLDQVDIKKQRENDPNAGADCQDQTG